MGCAAMQMAYVASGKYDVYVTEYLKPWDLAAGAIIIQEAGGYITNVDGSPFDVLTGSIAAASTVELCQKAVDMYTDAKANNLQLK